jgi:hypothetical protein
MNRLFSVLLVLGLCIFMVSAMWGASGFAVKVVATDGVMTDTLTLGNAVGATNGIDTLLGEIEMPPAPITAIFDVRSVDFESFTGHGQGLKTDYRPYRRALQTDTFSISWQPTVETGVPGTLLLTWDAGLTGYFHLIDGITGTIFNIDMTAQTTFTVPVGITPFYIIYGDNAAFQTASYFRITHEVDIKAKLNKATKPSSKTPWVLPNIVTIGTELDKSSLGALVGYQMGTDVTLKGVHLKKFADVMKSGIYAKDGTIHTQYRSCLDSTDVVDKKGNRKFIGKKNLTKMPPVKGFQNSALFAELMTLQFNIKLNNATYVSSKALPSAPTVGMTYLVQGHNGLTFDGLFINAPDTNDVLNPWNGQTIGALATAAGNALSCVPGVPSVLTMQELKAACEKINKSFIKTYPDTGNYVTSAAKLDTASFWNFPTKGLKWDKIYRINGIPIVKVPFLVRSLPAVAEGNSVPRTVAEGSQPEAYSLDQNYPNPFNPTTQIAFNLVDKGFVTVKIFNMLGQEVATLANHEEMTAGANAVTFDASSLASGAYFYRIAVNDEAGALKFQAVKKMMLVK